MSTMGVAGGTIMATIITAHMRNMNRKSATLQDWIRGIAMPGSIPSICQAR